MGCESLKSIVVPDSVKSVLILAFANCSALSEVTFAYCDEITSVTMPEGVLRLGQAVFYECTRLQSVNLPSTIREMETHVFHNDSALVSVNIPEGVTSIPNHTFFSSMVKELLLTTLGTTISIVLTFGTAYFVEQRQTEQAQRQTVIMLKINSNDQSPQNCAAIIMAVANRILNILVDHFNQRSADVNGDNTITVTDIMGIANIILKVNTTGSRLMRDTNDDAVEPQ